MKIFRRILAILFAICGAEAALSQEITISLDVAAKQITVLSPRPTRQFRYFWRCAETNHITGDEIELEFLQRDTNLPNSQFLTFAEIEEHLNDNIKCDHISLAYVRNANEVIRSNTLRIVGVRREGNPPHVTVNIDHIGDGYDEGDVYSFNVVYTDLFGVVQTVRNDEEERFNEVFGNVQWFKTGIRSKDNLIAFPSSSSTDNLFVNPPSPFPERRFIFLPVRDIECTGESCETELMPTLGDAIAYQPLEIPPPPQYPHTYTLSHSHFFDSYHIRDNGEIIYLDHFAVRITDKWEHTEQPFSGLTQYGVSWGFIPRNEPTEVSQLELYRSIDPFQFSGTPAEEPVSFGEFAFGGDKEKLYNLFSISGDLNNGVKQSTRFIWQHRINGGEWITTEDERIVRGTYFTSPDHFVGAKIGDEIQIRGILDVEDGWGLRNYLFSPTLSHTDMPPTGDMQFIETGLHAEATITTSLDEIEDPDGEIDVLSYRWQAGNGTVFTDILFQEYDEANRRLFADSIRNVPYILDASVFNQEGNSGMRVIAELTDSFFGQATITSGFFLVNPPTEGTVSINGNPLFADGEIYTLTNVDELTDESGIGTFSYSWYVSIDGGNSYDRRGAFGTTFTLKASHIAEANLDNPVLLRADVVHTDADRYTQTLVAFFEQNFPTQGEITIDGNPMFADGEVYTAITAALSDENDIGDFTYQWFASIDDGNNYNEIAGETGESYTFESGDFAGADENTPAWLQVSVVHTDADGYRFTLSASLVQDTPTKGEMTIDGSSLFEAQNTYIVATDSLTDGNGIGLFNDIQWAISFDGGVNYNDLRQNTELPRVYRLNTRDFAGANPNTPARLRVSAVHTDLEGYTQPLTAILIQNIPTQGEITIDGNPMFADGEVYTAITAGLSDSNEIGGFTYQWLVSTDDGNNYNEIADETGETYTANTADFAGANPNTPIFLGVSAVHTDLDGYAQTITAFLEQDLPTQGDIVLNVIANPLVLGEVKFSVNVDALTDGNDIGGFAYQWFASIARDADYNPISAATDRSYILDRSDFAGAAANEPVRISVSVVHTDLAGYEQSFGDFFVQNPRTEGEITIDGNPMFADGEVYTAITAALSDRNGIGDFTYQWVISFDGGNNYNTNGILGIDSTYTLRAEDIANADANIPALLGVAAVHTDLDGNTQTLTASFLQDIAGTGSVSISGANSFAAGEKYTAITNIADANRIGTVSYSWQASTDGGNNYTQITDANSESYTLALSDFAGATSANPVHLLLSVVHTDAAGFSEFYLATLIHSDTAAGGSLGIEIQSGVIAEDAIVELNTAGISDINGGGIVSHSWHLDNGAAIVGATAATYILSSANLTLSEIRNGVLHSEVLYRDSFGYETRFSITLFGEGDDEVANPDPNHPGTTTNPVDPGDNPGGEDPDNPGNIFGTGSVSISGANSFAAGEKYTAITNIADANMIGTVSYSWQASTDGGNNYNLITDANSESYTLALSDFSGATSANPVHLLLSVVHTDAAGFSEFYLATLIHSDTAAGGSLGIGIRDGIIAEDAVVELETAGISDINGGGIISHSWHLDNGAAIAGATAATYTLQAANLTLSEIRNGVLHSEVLYRDSFGYETRFSITLFGEGDDEEYDPNNPNELDSLGTGTVAISGTISFAANEKYTADISDIAPNDANGEGDFAYSWHTSTDGGTNYDLISGATLELYTLALSDFAGANANAEVHLRVSVVHTDFGGFDQSYLATLIHSDTAAGGSLGIEIQSGVIAEDAIVELNTAGISDINGGGIVSHSWHLDNGAAIAGETSATYTLQSANLTLSEIRNGVLHSEVLYRDSFGYETRFSITLFGEGDDEEYDPDNPNELDSMGTGTVAISGTISFAANERYTADISDIAPNDANGKGTFTYSWHTSTDGGTNYDLISGATLELYTLALSDFAGANANAEVHLRVSVVHTDFGGFDQSYLATLIHSDTAAGGSLGIEIQSGVIAEDAVVELNTAGISDINGGGIVSHSWHLDNGAAIVGATAATYILSSANLTLSEIRNGVLHSEVLYRDSFGYETRFSITLFGEGDDEEYDPDNPNELDSLGTGTVAISGTISFAAGEKYTADISDIAPNDANGEGDFAYSWHTSTDGGTNYDLISGATLELYTLALSDFAGANANAEVHLRVSVVHTDFGGFDQSYLATLIHSDTAAGGSLGIGIQSGVIAEDAIVELDTAAISDINGGGIVSHSWHLDNGAAIVGATAATYILSSANLTLSEIRNGVLHSEVLYRDSFGYETRFSITLFGEGDDEVANPDPNHPGTTTNPVDPGDNPGGEDPDNPGNIFGTGSVSISGANSFAAGEKYTAITNIADANMIGTVSYSWQASTDGGNNYNLITDANSESYTLALSDFSGATSANPVHLLLSVVHTDAAGFSEFYLATLIHSDTAAGGSLGIGIRDGIIAEDAVVELETAGISDINGGGIISHSWHLDNGAAIAGATAATYTLQAANLTLSEIRNGVLHSEVLYRDSFGYETRFSITLFGEGDDEEYDPNNPNELDSLGTGTVAISGTISFAANEKYTADISDIAPNDANGEGDFAYSWHTSTDGGTNYDLISGATLELYTLALSDFAGANANAEVHLRVSVVHTDFGGFDQSYLATLIHSDTAAGGSLGIGIQSGVIAEDAIVELNTAGISDINGGGIVSHSWHLDNGAAIAGETSATYTLQSANLTLSEIRNGVLHSEVLYRDSFGYETRFSITLFGEGDDEEYDPDNPNELDSMGTGTVAISGTISFAANEKYTADISDIAPNDANGKGDFAYSWHTSTDGGTNYNLISGANSESYTLALSDFAGANANAEVHLRVSVVHTDFGGFDQSYLATLIHSDTAAGGSLGIEIQSGVIAEDAIVELDTAAISDINGGGIVSHSWHLDNGAAIAGETSATYTLQSANLTLSEIRNGVLHSEVLYRDSFGYETRFSITLFGEGDDEEYDPDNPNELDSMGTGTVAISGTISFAANERYTADISDIAPNDANGKGTFTYSWHTSTDGGTNYDLISGATLELYTLALSDFAGANANAEVHLRVSVVHTDFGGFDQSYLATLIHSDTAAGGTLGIGIRNGIIAEDAIVELNTAAISDINGGGIVSHSWHLDNGAAIVGATAATYILSSANLTLSEIRNGVLHSEVLYRDSFGYETRFSITLFGEGDDEEYDPNNPNELDSLGTGTVAISGTISFAANEKYTADISDIAPNDANGKGDFAYSWHTSTDGGTNYNLISGANSESYTLALSDFAGANANAEVHLRVSVVHTDFGGFDQSYLATLIHSDTAAGGSLEIVAAGLMAGDLVTADAAGLADANGALTISYRWQTGERNTPESFADLVGETEAVYTIYADDYDSGSRDSLRLIARTADPFGGETEITSAILPINRETEGRISLELVGGEIVAGATIRLRTDAVSDENGGGFEKYYWFINDLLLMEENDDFLVVRSDDLRDIAAGGLRAEAKYVDGIGFTVRLSARLIAAGIVAPSPEEIANWSVVIETEGVAFGEDLARANLIGAEQSDYYEVFYRWRTGVGIAFADERNVGGVGNYHQLEAANFNPQDHLRAIAEVELLSGTFVTLTSAPVQIDYPSIGAVRIVAGELLAPGVVVSADISDVRDANGGVNVVSERWLYADTPVAMARSYTLTEEAVHAGKVFYEATFADAAGFRTSLRAEANVGGEVSSEKAEAIIGAVNAAAIDGLWNALEGHLDSEAGWRANGAPIEDPSQIAAALSRRDENSLHPDSPFALDSFALKESGGEAGEEWSWWAHGSRSRLKGKPIIDGEEVKYHGDYASFHAGMDRQISDTVRAGLAFSADDADLDVEWRKGVDGQLRQNIRSLIPYTEWRPDDLTNVRILAGYGEGDIYLAEHDNASRASARRTLFGIRAARRKDLADNFDITFSGGFDKTRLQTDAIDLPGLQDDLDARTKETHARVRGGHISLLPAKGSLHKEISLRWRSQSVAGDRDSVFDFGIGFNATLPEYFLSFGADGERQLTDSAHERNRFGVYIAYGAGRFAHILETRYDNEIALPQNRWQINTVSEWGVSELLTGVYVEHNGNADLRIGWESNLLF